MDTCDVLVVGGGPAGSTCAWKLRAGRRRRPRHRSGEVPARQGLRRLDYAAGDRDVAARHHRRMPRAARSSRSRVPTGVIGGSRRRSRRATSRPVSYGIRRCEFDDYLLRRSAGPASAGHGGQDGESVRIGRWVVNGKISARGRGRGRRAFLPGRPAAERPRRRRPRSSARRKPSSRSATTRRVRRRSGSSRSCISRRTFAATAGVSGNRAIMNIGIGRLGHDPVPKAYAEFVDFSASARQGARRRDPGARAGTRICCTRSGHGASSTTGCCSSATPPAWRFRRAARASGRPSSRASWRPRR